MKLGMCFMVLILSPSCYIYSCSPLCKIRVGQLCSRISPSIALGFVLALGVEREGGDTRPRSPRPNCGWASRCAPRLGLCNAAFNTSLSLDAPMITCLSREFEQVRYAVADKI